MLNDYELTPSAPSKSELEMIIAGDDNALLTDIRAAEYLTELPTRSVLEQKFRDANQAAQASLITEV